MTTRRNFIMQTGLMSGALILNPGFLSAAPSPRAGLQLYTLRAELPKDVKGVIAKVARAGYGFVETFGYDKNKGYWGLSARDFNQLLKDNGLSSVSGHYGINSFFANGDTSELKMYMEVAHALGQEYVLVPSLPGELIKTVDECKKIAEKLNKVAEICKADGLKTGYHNHNFEWKPVENTSFYDVLLKYTDPATVHMEMDVYWVVRAGQDPVALLRQYPGRFMLMHIKDRDRHNANLTTEVGKGDIDFKSIITASRKAGAKYMIVEQENFTNIDPFISITESCSYLTKILRMK